VAAEAEIVALVGESGCGKSTLARIVTSLDRATSGEIRMARQNIATLEASRQSRRLPQSIQMIFQNPDTTLNPSHTAGFSIRGSLKKFGISKGRAKIDARMREIPRNGAAASRLRPAQAERAFRRPEAAHRHRASLRRQSLADRRRRAVPALDVSAHAAVVTLLLACANLMRPPLKTAAARMTGADP
jgi:peptide/nickel transport system ATP-binding protein